MGGKEGSFKEFRSSDDSLVCCKQNNYLFTNHYSLFTMLKNIPWKKILEIVIAVLTAIVGTLSVQSCL